MTGATRVVNGGATWSWAYAYDPAGNRVQMSENQGTALTTSYLTNGVNQYHWTDRPAAGTKPRVRQNLDYDADGNLVEAYVVGDVNCDGAFDSFDTDAFALAVSDPQEYAVQYPNCDILNADINGDGSVNGFDTDAFTDLLTSGGNSGAVWEAYVWDGENRLVEVRPGSASPPSGSKKTTFAYDFAGRRIGKKVYNRTAGGVWNLTQDRQFVYDGWNLLLELDATQSGSPVARQHTWGLDLAGQNVAQSPSAGNVAQSPSAGNVAQSPSAVTADAAAGLHAAGGVGGLLATHDAPGGQPTRDFVHFYDANGNVTQLIDLSSGSAAAKYEYDAFGNELVRTGTFATSNRFRFSTKYTDASTDFAGEGTDGLSYYGFRYYSPRLGRWMSRDPIGEAGGVNLYGFASNDPLDEVDTLGLFDDEAVDDYMKRLERSLERGNTSSLCTQGDDADALVERGCRFVLNVTGGEAKLPILDPGPDQEAILTCADIILTVDCVAGGVQTARYAVVKGGKIIGWLRELPRCAKVPVRPAAEVCDAAGDLAKLGRAAEAAESRAACEAARCELPKGTAKCVTAPAIPKTYERPSGFRKGVREDVWRNAKGPDGRVRDPVTGREMRFEEPWDMGHKPGYEFRKLQKSALDRGLSRKQFLDEYNDAGHFRPELPCSNRGHRGELKTEDYFGP
ncbi:MAG: hypothetical protein CHACPFDD_03229 [Phycisphaerae bacterium]|nr:hypothetical protein [Phycisphaerae bacterium]